MFFCVCVAAQALEFTNENHYTNNNNYHNAQPKYCTNSIWQTQQTIDGTLEAKCQVWQQWHKYRSYEEKEYTEIVSLTHYI